MSRGKSQAWFPSFCLEQLGRWQNHLLGLETLGKKKVLEGWDTELNCGPLGFYGFFFRPLVFNLPVKHEGVMSGKYLEYRFGP